MGRAISENFEKVQELKLNWCELTDGELSKAKIASKLGISISTVGRFWTKYEPQRVYSVKKPKVKLIEDSKPINDDNKPKHVYKNDGVIITEYSDLETLIIELGECIKRTRELKAIIGKIL